MVLKLQFDRPMLHLLRVDQMKEFKSESIPVTLDANFIGLVNKPVNVPSSNVEIVFLF